jgi:hypothetical protein
VSRMNISTFGTVIRNSDEKTTLGKPGRKRENNIKVDIKDTEKKDVDRFIWIRLVASRGLL